MAIWFFGSSVKIYTPICTDLEMGEHQIWQGWATMKKLWREPLINQPFARNKGESAEFRFYTEFQSHEPEFDYLKSLEIEEKINQIRWLKRVHVRQQTQITHTERQRETDRQTDRQAGR